MICVFDKATDRRKRVQHVVKFRVQIGIIQFRRRGHLDPAVEEAIEIRVVWRLLEFTYARQKSLFEAWRGLSEIAAVIDPPLRSSSSRFIFSMRISRSTSASSSGAGPNKGIGVEMTLILCQTKRRMPIAIEAHLVSLISPPCARLIRGAVTAGIWRPPNALEVAKFSACIASAVRIDYFSEHEPGRNHNCGRSAFAQGIISIEPNHFVPTKTFAVITFRNRW